MKNLSQKLLEDVTANTGHYPNGDNEIPMGTRTANDGTPASPKNVEPDEFALPKEVSDAIRAMLSTHKSLDDQQNKSDVDLIWDLSQWMRTENISNQDEYIGFLIKHGMPENLAHQLLAILGVEVKTPGSEAKEPVYKVGDKVELVLSLMKLPVGTKAEVADVVGNFIIIQVKGIKYSVHNSDIKKLKNEAKDPATRAEVQDDMKNCQKEIDKLEAQIDAASDNGAIARLRGLLDRQKDKMKEFEKRFSESTLSGKLMKLVSEASFKVGQKVKYKINNTTTMGEIVDTKTVGLGTFYVVKLENGQEVICGWNNLEDAGE